MDHIPGLENFENDQCKCNIGEEAGDGGDGGDAADVVRVPAALERLRDVRDDWDGPAI